MKRWLASPVTEIGRKIGRPISRSIGRPLGHAIGRSLGRMVLAGIFRLYRIGLSPLLGPSCRFEPSCSHYAEEAIGTHGVLEGSRLAFLRICRCHPFANPGLDPVPAPTRTPSRKR